MQILVISKSLAKSLRVTCYFDGLITCPALSKNTGLHPFAARWAAARFDVAAALRRSSWSRMASWNVTIRAWSLFALSTLIAFFFPVNQAYPSCETALDIYKPSRPIHRDRGTAQVRQTCGLYGQCDSVWN